MKKRILIGLTMIAALGALAGNLLVNVHTLVSAPVVSRRVTLTLAVTNGPVMVGPWMVIGDSVTQYTDTNGVTTFSNVLASGYVLSVAGFPGFAKPFAMPSTNGTVNVASLFGNTNSTPLFYTVDQVNALVQAASAGPGGVTNVIGPTNVAPAAAHVLSNDRTTNFTAVGISSPGSGSQSEQYGTGASAADAGTAVGANTTAAQYGVAVGQGTGANGIRSVAIGQSTVGGNDSIGIGSGVSITTDKTNSIGMGLNAAPSAPNQFMLGPGMNAVLQNNLNVANTVVATGGFIGAGSGITNVGNLSNNVSIGTQPSVFQDISSGQQIEWNLPLATSGNALIWNQFGLNMGSFGIANGNPMPFSVPVRSPNQPLLTVNPNLDGVIWSTLISSSASALSDLMPPYNALDGHCPVPVYAYNTFADVTNATGGPPHPSAQMITNAIQLMTTNGWKSAYTITNNGIAYPPIIWIDEGWETNRGANGHWYWQSNAFPSGSNIVNYIHASGFRAGIYEAIGSPQCDGFSVGATLDDLSTDVSDFYTWGVDAIKADTCTGVSDPFMKYALAWRVLLYQNNAIGDAAWRPLIMQTTIPAAPNYLIYPQTTSAYNVSESASSGDQFLQFTTVSNCCWMLSTKANFAYYQRPGHYNEFHFNGGGTFTDTNFMHMWVDFSTIMSSCMDFGQVWTGSNNMGLWANNTYKVAIGNDPGALYPIQTITNANYEVWYKPLTNTSSGSVAVLFANKGAAPVAGTNISVSAAQLGLSPNANLHVIDLNTGGLVGDFSGGITASVTTNCTVYYKVTSSASPFIDLTNAPGLADRWDFNQMTNSGNGSIGGAADLGPFGQNFDSVTLDYWTNNPSILNGYGWMAFNGGYATMNHPVKVNMPGVVFMVVQLPNSGVVYSSTDNANRWNVFNNSAGAAIFANFAGSAGANLTFPSTNTFGLLESIYSGSNSATLWNGKILESGVNYGTEQANGWTIGASTGLGQNAVAGGVAYMAVWTNNLSAAIQTNIAAWFSARFNLTNGIPAATAETLNQFPWSVPTFTNSMIAAGANGGVPYTNGATRGTIVGTAIMAATAGNTSTVTINYTNSGRSYVQYLSVFGQTNTLALPPVPLDPYATFTITASAGCSLTNTVIWNQ